VLEKTEIVVCNPKMLNVFLGPLRAPVMAQTQLFYTEIGEQDEESRLMRLLWMQRDVEEAREEQLEEAKRRESQIEEARRRASEGSVCPSEVPDIPAQTDSPETNSDSEETEETQSNSNEGGNARMSVLERLQMRHAKGIKGTRRSIRRGDDAILVAKRVLNQRGARNSPKPPVAQGSAANAVEWRSKRAGKPKAPQIGQNLDVMQGLLAYIGEHLQKFVEAIPDILSKESQRSPSKVSARTDTEKTFDEEDDTSDEEIDERSRTAESKDITMYGSEDTVDHFDDEERDVRIERVLSPVRTEKSRRWRAPSPYPKVDWAYLRQCDAYELAGKQIPASARQISLQQKEGKKPGSKREIRVHEVVEVDDSIVFDFCGLGNWKQVLRESSRQAKRHTRTSNSKIPDLVKH
jgi:hypothetical protein